MKIALPLIVSLGMLTTMICLSIGMATALPPGRSIPLPFGLGTDGMAPAGFALSIMPVALLLLTAAFALAPRISKTLGQKPERFVILWLVAVLVLAVGHGLIIRGALVAL